MSSTTGDHAEADFEWQEIMAIDADIEPVMWSIQHLRDTFTTIRGFLWLKSCLDSNSSVAFCCGDQVQESDMGPGPNTRAVISIQLLGSTG